MTNDERLKLLAEQITHHDIVPVSKEKMAWYVASITIMGMLTAKGDQEAIADWRRAEFIPSE